MYTNICNISNLLIREHIAINTHFITLTLYNNDMNNIHCGTLCIQLIYCCFASTVNVKKHFANFVGLFTKLKCNFGII